MEHYKNFQLAGYVWAYWLDRVGEDEIRESIETLTKKMPLKKVYLENHRGLVDVPQVKMRAAKKAFEEYGIETAGGITTTVLEGERKSAILDSFCYTDPRHRERLLGVVRELAEVFDEIILDDYFFTSCRCEMCIEAKVSRSWKDFRQALLLYDRHALAQGSMDHVFDPAYLNTAYGMDVAAWMRTMLGQWT